MLECQGAKCALELQSVARVYPGTLPVAPGKNGSCGTREIAEELQGRFGSPLHLINTGMGMGDHIVSLYAAAAAASTGLPVVFHTRHPRWLARVSHPGLSVDGDLSLYNESAIRSGMVIDVNRNYTQQIRYASSRSRWYASNVHPKLVPERPRFIDKSMSVRRIDAPRYAILAPSGNASNRDWPSVHWQRLILLLQEQGFEAVAIGTKAEEEKIAEICSPLAAFWAIDHPAEWIQDAILDAAVVVANDSGITHLGALLEVPTVGIHAQLSARFLWNTTNVIGVTPETQCACCHWRRERGYVPALCDSVCSALTTITPDRIMAAINTVVQGGVPHD